MTLATAPDPTGTLTVRAGEGCDSCGVDMLNRPLRAAEFRIDTPAGPIIICSSHKAQHEPAIAAQGLLVTAL